ncbi:hypothetical protein ACFE04_018360 [Oxalis oulophora]
MTDNNSLSFAKQQSWTNQSLVLNLKRWQWWFLVVLNIFFLIVGQAAAVLVGRYYYDKGGNSTWMATIVQTAGFPILFIPYFLFRPSREPTTSTSPSIKLVALIYFALGVVIAGDNMLYSTALLYLSASTFSLICATQLIFNAVFSYFINSQKFTWLILVSVIALSAAATLIGLNEDSDSPAGVSKSKYIVGFICALSASALYSLLLSLMQLSFQKVLKKETFSVVLEMQIYTSLVATCVSVIGLFASGDWKILHGEMENFATGQVSYIMTLIGTAVTWQVCAVGVVGLIFVVSSLFSNVISTLSLAVTPLAAVVVFHDKMSILKIVALLLSLLGFGTYTYQNYIDESKARKSQRAVATARHEAV